MSEYKLMVRLDGPSRPEESSYGPREYRDTLAQFDIEVEGAKAWRIFQEALARAVAPEFRVVYDPPASGTDAS